MTITTPDEFRRIGIEDGRTLGTPGSEPHMMFDPVGGSGHVAYLEGVIQGLRSQIVLAAEGDDTLRLNITREVEPKEIPYLVFGTGALSYPWWGRVTWVSVIDGEEFPVDVNGADWDTAEPTDVLIITHDGPDSDEGAMDVKTRLTFHDIIAAVAVAVEYDYVYEKDAISEDLGLLDAEQADTVLQLAVFGGTKAVFG
jgi:hypothetical protein